MYEPRYADLPPTGPRRRSRRRAYSPLVIAAVLVAALSISGLVWWWVQDDDPATYQTQTVPSSCVPPQDCTTTSASLPPDLSMPPQPTSSGTTTAGPSSFSASSPPVEKTVPAATLPSGVTLARVDGGGPSYFSRFSHAFPTSNTFFPVGMWAPVVNNPDDVKKDQASGVNTYVALWDSSNPEGLQGSTINVITQYSAKTTKFAPYVNGWLGADEADMWAKEGNGSWNGNKEAPQCTSGAEGCGFTVMKNYMDGIPKDNRLRWNNYGKGVAFWASETGAKQFVNEYQDVVSADIYWYTDTNVCAWHEGGKFISRTNPRDLSPAECHRAANYGATVKRLRSLVSPPGSKPVWAFIEVGHPGGKNGTIKPEQVRAAVWSSLINGARGITYFNHSFGGACPSFNILREGDCYNDVRATVTELNATIKQLAPVLNSPDVKGLVSVSGKVDVLVKALGADLYIFSGSTGLTSQQVKFALKCTPGAAATVLGENRTVPVAGNSFTDTFASESAVHLYTIPGGATRCGLAN